MLEHARRATLALTTTAVMATTFATGPAASAAAADVTPQAASAADWLAVQIDEGLVASEYQDGNGEWIAYTDYGLSLDFFYAFDGLGVKRAVRRDILDAIEPQVGSYIGSGDTAYAGATGKLLTAVLELGIDPDGYASGDLVQKLEGLVHTAPDSEQGRAKDTWDPANPYGGDYSNTLGQSFVVRALTAADSDLADETVEFLLKQQCAKGFFRVYMESSDHTCASGRAAGQSGPSVDATATAVLALIEARGAGVAGLGDDIKDAAAWLVAEQADNGSFADGGVANANSTGLASQALASLDKPRAAERAASWLGSLQVTVKIARDTAFRRVDVGAVAFSKAALREGKQEGITRDVRYQWRRATAQAAVGLDS